MLKQAPPFPLAGVGVPAGYPEDAVHIALAKLGGMDFFGDLGLCAHQQRLTRVRVRQIVKHRVYACPEVVSPDELLEEEP